jgi:hypothetical protein
VIRYVSNLHINQLVLENVSWIFGPSYCFRQTSGSSSSAMGTLTSAKKLTVGGDFLNFKVSPHLIYDRYWPVVSNCYDNIFLNTFV